MDFLTIKEREGARKGVLEVYPDFRVIRSKDLMVRGKHFYAVWDEKRGVWSQDEYDIQRLVDEELDAHEIYTPGKFEVVRKYLGNFSTNSWMQFRNYITHISDKYVPLDETLTFANTEVKKEDYVSKRLPYPLEKGDISAWDALLEVLYIPEERAKIEWFIGSIISGDSKVIQKFGVFHGPPGSGKSTILNIMQMLFDGYWSAFEARALTSANNQFALEPFKANPLVAIDQDGDLSRIEDNTRLNSLVSHEWMRINEKNKPTYDIHTNTMIFVSSNKAVKITDANSGIIRRMIDIHPSGDLIPARKYQTLMSQIKFELGAIAYHCLQVYLSMGRDAYSGYRPIEMMLQTDVFFNYIEAYFDVFKAQNGVTLDMAFKLWRQFCEDSNIDNKMPRYKLREELKNYFETFEDRAVFQGERVRSWYGGFKAERFKTQIKEEEPRVFSLVMDDTESLFDKEMAKAPAQYSNDEGFPIKYWTNKPKTRLNEKTGKIDEYIPKPNQVVDTRLSDIDTSREHYVKVPENHIVVDFDLKDPDGNKSAERNLEAASQWPPTYAEYSKSEHGIHLHYIYEGDVSELSRIFDDGIEIKVFTGDSSLRRKLTRCNNVPIATLNSGLPLKEKKMIENDTIKSERGLRNLIERNIRKEIHPGTKPSMDFIHKILEDAYASGMPYDVTDMRQDLLTFANNSTNWATYCLKLLQTMKFASETPIEGATDPSNDQVEVLFDVEVFKNLLVVCWKGRGSKTVVKMINPTASQIEELFSLKLVGFNNCRYDNHILYGASMGLNNLALYELSQKIIKGVPNSMFGAAYDLSYTDIYDFSSAGNKKSLKKWQIDLGLKHQELGLNWDEPVPEELWQKVADYCANDVETTEAVFEHLEGDWKARQILAALSGLTVNDTTNRHSTRIMFGDNRAPQEEFVYTDLSEMFPGYQYDMGKSTYRGEITGEGGYVYAEPGMYNEVASLDAVSMHPTSIEQLNLFGDYTKKFSEIKNARVLIKRGDYESVRKMLDGKLAPFLDDNVDPKGLSDALKTVVNSIYGLTSARFDNAFRDPRNIDNIVAKRGALFMIELKNHLQQGGWQVVHIKTDGIKIANATKEVIDEVMEFGLNYGYEFEHEATYEKFCLVNDAVYIAKTKDGRTPAHWEAVGAQFQHPFVFKTLFSGEKIQFKDLCETKQVTSALYLDFTDNDEAMALQNRGLHFVGRTGLFCPIKPGKGGGSLMREKDGKYYAATGTKGYEWMEAEMVKDLGMEKDINMSYFNKLVDDAKDNISKYGDFEWFVS